MELYELRNIAETALDLLDGESAIAAAEVCASWCEQQCVRLAYDTEHPDERTQTFQARTVYGLSMLLVMESAQGYKVGFGVTSDDLSQAGILTALDMAKQAVAMESVPPTFPTLETSATGHATFHDPYVVTLPEDEIIQSAGEALEGALSTFQAAGYTRHLQIRGSVMSQAMHLVVGNTHGFTVASDTSTGLLATLSSRLVPAHSRGVGSSVVTHWHDFAAHDAGVRAAQQALQGRDSVTLAPGNYPVVFGPQAVAELLQELLLPALSLDTIAAGTSPFASQRGQRIAPDFLTITDDGRLPGMLGSRTITGDGLPTGQTTLIAQGHLVDFLADAYHAQHLATRLGPIVPRNGMRYTTHGASFCMRPGIFPTNVMLTSDAAVSLAALIAPVTHGIYIGSLWHTTPEGSLRTGDFTSLILGPSFVIEHGKLVQAIRPATIGLQENFPALLQRLTGMSTSPQAIALATGQSLVLAPALQCSNARVVSA